MTPERSPAPVSETISPLPAALARGAVFAGLWLVLMPSLKPADLVFGFVAAGCAMWASLALLPPAAGSVNFFALLVRVPGFLWQSVLAGVDVARRVFSPSLPLNPGFIRYATAFPPGAARNAFTSITSLMPGSVPCGVEDGFIVYHCLDLAQPVAEQLAVEERKLAEVLVPGQGHG